MENNDILKKAKNIIISSNENWILKNEDNDIVSILYKKEWEKASCWTTCCLWCLFWPAWLIYAILWWSNAIKKQINLHLYEWFITISWDSKFIIDVFNLLKKSEIRDYIKENDDLEKAKKSKLIWNFLILIVIILIIIIIVTNK